MASHFAPWSARQDSSGGNGPGSGKPAVEQGTTLKHYRILSRLGEGGMGVVYQAEDTRLGRTVALKILPEHLATSEDHLRRFEREARAASAINHPGIATLYDFDRDGDVTFLSMEYVQGKTLREVLQGPSLPIDQLLDCLIQIAEALSAAHQKGIIHRDLKPENVMSADSGFYKILDFGLARMELKDDMGFSSSNPTQWATVSKQITSEGKIVGTFGYMSPEQVQGHALDPRSDIFSFGTLVYELVTGTIPFGGNNAIAAFHSIVHEQPPPMSSRRDEVPQELEHITARCLAKDPAERYQTSADLAADLRRLHHPSGSGAGSYYSSPAFPRVAHRPARKRLMLWSSLGAVAVAAVGLTFWLSRTDPGTRSSAEPPAAPVQPAPFETASAGQAVRSRIAVAAFANVSNDPEADWLRQALPEMLTTDLARSSELEVISTQRMDDLVAAAGRESGENLDRATATELARWAGAGVVVSGSIYRAGDGYRIDVQASDTEGGDVLAASRVEGTDIFRMADQLAAELRNGLQVQAMDKQGIQEVTTSSPTAFRHFTAGMHAFQRLQLPQAVQAFEASLQEDPEFALSQLRLGQSLYLAGRRDEGLEWMARAGARAEHMPERERLLALGLHAGLHEGDAEAAAQPFAALSEKYPEDVEGLFWQAQVQARQANNSMKALQLMQQTMARDPESSLGVAGLAAYLETFQFHEEAELLVREFLERHAEVSAEHMRALQLSEGG
jgi:serine/threonine protein kinase/tetratricopeptide (TPR) repeat protein